MSEVAKIDDGHLVFWCEGCQRNHYASIGGDPRIKWDFNGSLEKPTLSPSVKYSSRNLGKDKDAEVSECCHFFVRDGKIEFCGDCTHEYAGQTLDMKPVSEWVAL
jgi:hypothetical protein